jgi:hypothetical protein
VQRVFLTQNRMRDVYDLNVVAIPAAARAAVDE